MPLFVICIACHGYGCLLSYYNRKSFDVLAFVTSSPYPPSSAHALCPLDRTLKIPSRVGTESAISVTRIGAMRLARGLRDWVTSTRFKESSASRERRESRSNCCFSWPSRCFFRMIFSPIRLARFQEVHATVWLPPALFYTLESTRQFCEGGLFQSAARCVAFPEAACRSSPADGSHPSCSFFPRLDSSGDGYGSVCTGRHDGQDAASV